ncbi:dipeptidyl aminopeptidase/acylaminoacyl peptidase [Cadophora sp. MPI-SDFR-AT-0126]|nr:dipeptidyl aminopeptidase/acylaminoacyl peptidase [Leotiomycetes sp. MPI-SDFR-AT-0126]
MQQFFPGIFFNFETVRIVGTISTGGAELAECLDAVGQIKDNDPESWHLAWAEQARKAEVIGQEARKNGHRAAAKNAFLRASNYTRASYYMMAGRGPLRPDPRLLLLCTKAVGLFRDATQFFDPNTIQAINIPYEGHTLSGYLHLPPSWRRVPGRQTPLLIANSGADGLSEEIYFFVAAAAQELGYAIITYEGPGQGLALHRDGLHLRPDWEVVVSAVIDQVEVLAREQPQLDLDLDHIAIWGTSLGGYFALRAAAEDSRIKACIAIDPVHDFWDFATTQVPKSFLAAWARGWIGDGSVDRVIGLLMRLAFQMHWNISLTGAIFGLGQPSKIMQAMKTYTLRLPDGGSLLQRINCPVLVTGASRSLYLDVSEHSTAVFDGLTNLKERVTKQLWVATSPGDGGLQAKVGALALSNQYVFRFLDEQFGIKREGL